MNSVPIEGATRRLGAPTNWDHSADGICHTLEIFDYDGWMISAWRPTEAELKRLNDGQPIFLWIQGRVHPVVSVEVASGPRLCQQLGSERPNSSRGPKEKP